MAAHRRTLGFILKKQDIREADRIFTIYTKDFGRLECLARGERKIKSKLRWGLELFYLSEIEFVQGKVLKTLTDVLLVKSFENIKKDLRILSVAYRVSEVLTHLVRESEADREIWDLIEKTFERLNNWKFPARRQLENGNLLKVGSRLYPAAWKPESAYYYFFWNFVYYFGYKPQLYNCVLCQKKLEDNALLFFLPYEGGMVCRNCARKIKGLAKNKNAKRLNIERVDSGTVKILRVILEKDWDVFCKLKASSTQWEILKNISERYYYYLIPL